jgi:hypothetical protein
MNPSQKLGNATASSEAYAKVYQEFLQSQDLQSQIDKQNQIIEKLQERLYFEREQSTTYREQIASLQENADHLRRADQEREDELHSKLAECQLRYTELQSSLEKTQQTINEKHLQALDALRHQLKREHEVRWQTDSQVLQTEHHAKYDAIQNKFNKLKEELSENQRDKQALMEDNDALRQQVLQLQLACSASSTAISGKGTNNGTGAPAAEIAALKQQVQSLRESLSDQADQCKRAEKQLMLAKDRETTTVETLLTDALSFVQWTTVLRCMENELTQRSNVDSMYPSLHWLATRLEQLTSAISTESKQIRNKHNLTEQQHWQSRAVQDAKRSADKIWAKFSANANTWTPLPLPDNFLQMHLDTLIPKLNDSSRRRLLHMLQSLMTPVVASNNNLPAAAIQLPKILEDGEEEEEENEEQCSDSSNDLPSPPPPPPPPQE